MMAYLDNSATTRPTEGVIARMARAMRDEYYNPSSMYAQALIPELEMDKCREKITKSLSADGARVIFTSGGTEANNLALLGALAGKRAPVRAAVSAVEHPSVLNAAKALEARGAQIEYLDVDARGQLNLGALKRALDKGLALVSCMQVNNETGAVLNIQALKQTMREYPETLLHVDGVQGFLREEMDFRRIDMYTLSAHKIHGPKGVGALVVRAGVKLSPLALGGDQENALRGGTQNTPGILGLSQAIDDMRALGATQDIRAELMRKKLMFVERVQSLAPEALINGPAPEAGCAHIVNISFPGTRGEVMLHALEQQGVLCSTGAACSSKKLNVSHVLAAMGLKDERARAALRFSFSPYTTHDEIEYAARAAAQAYNTLKRFVRR